ncbi:TonB-dependent receptor plug domain-containing protein, partial [Bacteroides finegoldii]
MPDIKNSNYVEIDEVVIVGKSEACRQQEQAFAISVADLSKNYNTSVDIGTITNRMAGVKLRVNSGVGSDYNFTLNGFSGRQVKFFMNGLA